MKITHFINSLGTGGAETLVVALASQQKKEGKEVQIVVLSETLGEPLKKAYNLGLNVVILSSVKNPLMKLNQLREIFNTSSVVHVHLFPCLYIAAFVNTRTPKIFTEHSTTNRRRKYFLARIFEKYIYSKYDQITCVTDGSRETLTVHLNSSKNSKLPKISTVPNGIDDSFFKHLYEQPKKHKPLRVISIGTLDSRKNFTLAVRIARELREQVKLTILGDGNEKTKIQSLIALYSLENHVTLRGVVTDVQKELLNNDLLLITSRHEGFSLVAAEAMASGLPVIGPDIAGLREVVSDGETGLLVDPTNNTTGYIDAINKLIVSDSLFEELSRKSVDFSKQFTIAKTSSRYQNIYEQIT
jgi:glycosyltransferase involved in cell wall biosynthesis